MHTHEDPTVYQRLRTNQISSIIENELKLNFQKIPLKMIFEIMQNLSLKSGWMNKYLMDFFPWLDRHTYEMNNDILRTIILL